MKSYSFELKDIGAHFQVPASEASNLTKGSGAIIRVGKAEVPVTLRWIQPLKDPAIKGLWYFPPKGMGKALVEHRGEKATITYPVTLTDEQKGIKPKIAKTAPATSPVTPVKPKAEHPLGVTPKTKAAFKSRKKAVPAKK